MKLLAILTLLFSWQSLHSLANQTHEHEHNDEFSQDFEYDVTKEENTEISNEEETFPPMKEFTNSEETPQQSEEDFAFGNQEGEYEPLDF